MVVSPVELKGKNNTIYIDKHNEAYVIWPKRRGLFQRKRMHLGNYAGMEYDNANTDNERLVLHFRALSYPFDHPLRRIWDIMTTNPFRPDRTHIVYVRGRIHSKEQAAA